MFAILASIMMLASCANDDFSPITERDGEVAITMTTSLPQDLQSYALNSAEGGLVNIENENGNYAVRYIMEVYPKNSTEMVKRMITYVPITKSGNYKSTSFSTRLIAAEYNFVFWADIVKKVTAVDAGVGADLETIISTLTTEGVYGNRYLISKYAAEGNYLEDNEAILAYNTGTKDHYDTTSLQNVNIGNAADSHFQSEYAEANDAYRNVTTIDLRSDSPVGTITLTRPFAKLRVISTDKEIIDAQGINLSNVMVSPTFSVDMPSTINVLTGATSGNIAQFGIMQSKLASYSNEENGEYYTIGVWYCLPLVNKTTNVDLGIGVKGDSQYTGINVSVASVPLVENKVTTIKGKLFSKNAEVSIIIDDDFENVEDGEPVDQNIIYGAEAETPEDFYELLSGDTQGITYTGKVTKENGLTLNFANATRSASKFAEGNTAILAIKIPNIEQGAVITIEAGTEAPQKVVLNTGNTKCHIRLKSDYTQVVLGGSTYGNLVYNQKVTYNDNKNRPTVDAYLIAGGGISAPLSGMDYHRISLNADFTLPASPICQKHTDCTFLNQILTWLESNSGKTVFDFVEANK